MALVGVPTLLATDEGGEKPAWRVKLETRAAEPEEGHVSSATLTFSADCKRLAGGGAVHCRVWEARTGKELALLRRHEGVPTVLFFSRDGRLLLTTDQRGVSLWEVASGKELTSWRWRLVVPGPRGGRGFDPSVRPLPLTAAAYSPNGRLVAGGNEEGQVELWDLASVWDKLEAPGKPIVLESKRRRVRAFAFGPGRTTLAVLHEGGVVGLWDLKTGKETVEFEHRATSAQSLHVPWVVGFSADGLRLLTANPNVGLKVWDRAGKEVASLAWPKKKEGEEVTAMALAPDRNTFALGRADGTIELWDVAPLWKDPPGRAAVRSRLRDHPRGGPALPVDGLVFSPDGRLLALGGHGFVSGWECAGKPK
jgi:WD40 repeat protein